MDRFYLDNAGLYQTLVKAIKSPPASKDAMVTKDKTSPDMVVAARIRPLLDEDIAAGFTCAVFPRSRPSGRVDIYDLYNHPRGRPIINVDRCYPPESRANSQSLPALHVLS